MALASFIGIDSFKPETGKEDASVEGNGDGNGQVPPGQTEDGDGNIVNPGGNMAPGLNRGEHIDKPDNPNKPDKPENPGTEDKDDKKANKANKGTHIYTYDELNRMVSSEIAKVLTNYTYDTLGNLVLETSKNKSVDYEYNELNQLVRKTTSNNEVYTYTYDKRGNRIAETGKKASQSFVYDATNRLVEGTNWKGDTSAYTYNGLGLRVNNLVTTHAGKTYDRDYVIDYTSPENDDLYVYAMGNGQLEYEQCHVYAGSERIEQITERGTSSWERTLYVHEDVMGNTRYYTKTTGQTFAELQYDAWGQPVSPNKLLNNDHGNYVFATFTGHIYDPVLDIYFAEARFYDSTNRTWMAMDPIKDGLNWYQYCLSNPTTNWDPTGLAAYGAMPQYFEQMSGCTGMPDTPYAAGLQAGNIQLSEYLRWSYTYSVLIRLFYGVTSAHLWPSVREYLNNKALWEDYAGQGDYINNQRDKIFASFQYGLSNMLDAGCGPIAIYNALIATGNSANLAEIAYWTALEGGRSLGGLAGTDPASIGRVLDDYGVSNQGYSTLYSMEQNLHDGEAAIVLIVNNDSIRNGMHYYVAQKNGDDYTVYNNAEGRNSNSLAETMGKGTFVYGYIVQ